MTPTGKNFFILLATIVAIVLFAAAIFFFIGRNSAFAPIEDLDDRNFPTNSGSNNNDNNSGAYCTMDAKLCPDGSYVGRTGPNCEFAACPIADSKNSGIAGTATMGPTCPVVRPDMEDQCKDKPFTDKLVVLNSVTQKEVKRFTPNSLGQFQATLPAGKYIIISSPEKILPHCNQTVTVEPNKFTNININCDTGIR